MDPHSLLDKSDHRKGTKKGRETCPFRALDGQWNPPKSFGRNGGDDGTRTRGLCRDSGDWNGNWLEPNGTDSTGTHERFQHRAQALSDSYWTENREGITVGSLLQMERSSFELGVAANPTAWPVRSTTGVFRPLCYYPNLVMLAVPCQSTSLRGFTWILSR